VIRAAKLDLQFDAERMRAELAVLQDWERHFNRQYYEGDWSGVALRANNTRRTLYLDPDGEFFTTEAAARVPYIFESLSRFECEVRAARLLKLGTGAAIKEHRDAGISIDGAEARLHVPVMTNDDTDFFVDGELIPMKPGECWYINIDLPHRAANRGATDRVHLVLDVVVNEWLRNAVSMAGRMH
jgi:Aspartyl/Asparaginyl beta-hydroxylase